MQIIRLVILLSLLLPQAGLAAGLPDSTWFEQDANGNTVIHVYFFWSKKCPHCLEALPFVEILKDDEDLIKIHSLQLVGEPENVTRYQWMMRSLQRQAQSVPAFVFCNTVLTGYDPQLSPQQIEGLLDKCRQHIRLNGNLENYSVSEFEQGRRGLEEDGICRHPRAIHDPCREMGRYCASHMHLPGENRCHRVGKVNVFGVPE